MKYFSTLIKPAGSLCNMSCSYCFYADASSLRQNANHSIMSDEIMDVLIERVFTTFNEEAFISFAFQGGEPLLAGLAWFERFIKIVDEHKKSFHHVQYSIQTNGLNLNEQWAEFFHTHDFLVGVSLDGFVQNHDALRTDAKNHPTYEKVMRNVRLLQKAQVKFNVLTVLTSSLSHHPERLFQFYRKNELRFVQLIPCLPELGKTKSTEALSARQFLNFYDCFYELWLKEFQKGNVFSVSFFDNLIPMFAGIPPQQCGFLGQCHNQFVIESDGSVYPCDFYALDKWCLGKITQHSLMELALSEKAKEFVKAPKERSKHCQDCRYEGICHGQCRRLSVCYADENLCALKEFMRKHEKSLYLAAQKMTAGR